MKVLLFGSVLFGLAFVFHLILWRIRLPKRQTKTLLQVFLGTLAIGLTALHCLPSLFGFGGEFTIVEVLHAAEYFIALLLGYMITYSAIEADSPSLVMITRIADAGSEGLSRKDFENQMTDELLVVPRVNDLILDKMAYLDDDRYQLSPKGRLMANIFITYRKILNAPKGG